jgi:O-antigen/teichoic acid export membrane protein
LISRRDSYFREGPRARLRRNLLHPWFSRLASVSSVLRHNQDLLRNASSLLATTGITSALGFAYWIYAARVFSPEAVGYASAAISAMMLLGTIGMFGLDTMLIGELPRGRNRGRLIMTCCIAGFIISLVLGLGFALVSPAFGTHFVEINGTFIRIALFSFGVAISGATAVFDNATIGLMRGGIQLSRNVALSVAKMAALPAAAFVLHDTLGVGIMLAWVIGIVLSLPPVAIMIKRGRGKIFYRPDWTRLWRLRKVALAHNSLNLAITIPTKLVPVLVAIVVTPAANGAFYIANMMFSFLLMVPASLSTVLFAVASAAPEKIPEKLRFVLRMSLIIGISGGLAMALCAHLILSIFGSSYAILATGPLWLLILSYLPGLPNTVYIAVARVKGRFNQAAAFLAVCAALRMAALVVGGKVDGLYGLCYGMLAVQLVQSMITTPAVLRTAFGRVTIRLPAESVATSAAGLRPVESTAELQLRQEAGLAALVALATRVGPSQPGDAVGAIPTHSSTRSTLAPPGAAGISRRRHVTAGPITAANPAIADTNWWPDIDGEAFRFRQEAGVAALISIATSATGLLTLSALIVGGDTFTKDFTTAASS